MRNRMVYHVNQQVAEYYKWNIAFKCYQNIDKFEGYDWKVGSFDYIELTHNNEKDKYGLYGNYIKW